MYRFHALVASGVVEGVRVKACSTRVRDAGARGGGQIPNVALNWSMAISQFLIWDDVSEISLKEGQSGHGGE